MISGIEDIAGQKGHASRVHEYDIPIRAILLSTIDTAILSILFTFEPSKNTGGSISK